MRAGGARIKTHRGDKVPSIGRARSHVGISLHYNKTHSIESNRTHIVESNKTLSVVSSHIADYMGTSLIKNSA